MAGPTRKVRAGKETGALVLQARNRVFACARPRHSATAMSSASATKKKFAILVTGDPLSAVVEKHGDFEKRFKSLLSSGGETWDAFRVFDGEKCPGN